jgi:hypothetical protein
MHRTSGLGVLAALLLIVLGGLPAARPARAQDRDCFPETGQCVEGRFLRFWRESGGLREMGFPITPARDERNPDTGQTYLTQWFERNRFELHPENAAPYDVLLGRLGADRLAALGRNWQAEGRESGPKDGCLWFAQTGHNVCDQQPGVDTAQAGFMSYWRYTQLGDLRLDPYGRSLALHGLPLTEARMETNASGDRVLTQWFERTRMEWHPNNPPGFRVLLGLLGSELRGGTSQQPAGNIRYVNAGALHELQPDGTSRRITALADQGKVLDAVHWQDQVIVLSERGLQRVAASGAQTIATFTQGQALFGTLTAPENSGFVFYSYARSAGTPTGFTGVVGTITNGTSAAKLFDAPNVVTVLGLSTDSKGLLVIDRGQDPSFGQARVIQIPTGETIGRLPIGGVGAVAQSPDRVNVRVAAIDQPGEHPDVLNLYELGRADLGRRVIQLPRRGWNAWQLLWSRDSRQIYVAMAPSVSEAEFELYRVDVASGRGELVASKLPPDTRLIRMSPDDRQIVAATQTTAGLIDLATGTFNRQTVPAEALIVR